ncbi:hypothetical protein HELRODRAFT_183364 [Helobdella robusta]|uniref:C-type lectin domain-containing protein n=1 Tax=Helobdella robusta TaxID=6412 RepID=T1FJI5_HELRO|nr:hypothetical protein HELRODRAFT_183364 [Helobdella robusta]ESO11260.1 hypothetical protein HELRODRAFT_183364 [Helobdella robusta]
MVLMLMCALLQFGIVCGGQTNGRIYSRAFSYLAVSGQRSPVCYDDRMDIVTKLKAASSLECILKCLITTMQNLRGINYVSSMRSCTCVPKLNNFWYNVTADLNASCFAFVSHDCPKPFDYIIEVHKCYSMVTNLMDWSTAGKACNNASGHLLAVEDEYENLAALKYPLSVSKGVNIPLSFYGWYSGEPNGIANGNNYCLQYLILPECAWDDFICTVLRCSLCEIDITL